MKTCPSCRQELDRSAFGSNKARPDGLSFYCRACNRDRNRRWYRASRSRGGHEVRDLSWVPAGHRWCPTCKQAVPEADYSRNAAVPSGFGAECRPCRRTSQNEAYFLRKYGLSRAAVAVMREEQADRCAICGDLGAGHLDHAHDSGVVRALLCSRCNMGLGLFLEDRRRLLAAVAYLEKHESASADTGRPPAAGCGTTSRLGSDRAERRGLRPGRRRTDRVAHDPSGQQRSGPDGPAEEAHG